MYETLKRMKQKGNLTEGMVRKAVQLGWINEDEAETLI